MPSSRQLVSLLVTAPMALAVYRLLTETMPSAVVLYGSRNFGMDFTGCTSGAMHESVQPPEPFVSNNKPLNISFDNAFGACLLIKDDNHILAEWLAYHYHVLPLRRLIVAVDPFSETTPTAILDRYRKAGLMKITEWNEVDIMPPKFLSQHITLNQDNPVQSRNLHRSRQNHFYAKCMAVLKMEGLSWTAFTDTDEYIFPNRNASEEYRFHLTEKQTIYDILSNPENQEIVPTVRDGCLSMPRLQFGHKESNQSVVQRLVPTGFNGSHFSTFRWYYHENPQSPMRPSKCLVNLRLAEDGDFEKEEVNAHRPNKRLCPKERLFVRLNQSPLVVNHYSGSWEQWNYRRDIRKGHQKDSFDRMYYENEEHRSRTMRPWLQDFVAHHGYELASYLLQGAGQLEPKPGSNHTR